MDDSLKVFPEADGTLTYYGFRRHRKASENAGPHMIPERSRFCELDTGNAYIRISGRWVPMENTSRQFSKISRLSTNEIYNAVQEELREVNRELARVNIDMYANWMRQEQVVMQNIENIGRFSPLRTQEKRNTPISSTAAVNEKEKCLSCGEDLDIRIDGRRKYCSKCGCYLPEITYGQKYENVVATHAQKAKESLIRTQKRKGLSII